MGARYKRNGELPILEHCTINDVIRLAEAWNLPTESYTYSTWWSFAELADIYYGGRAVRKARREAQDDLVTDYKCACYCDGSLEKAAPKTGAAWKAHLDAVCELVAEAGLTAEVSAIDPTKPMAIAVS